MNRRINWPQVWAEVGLLLAGALVAFGADALWDERRDRAEEREYLAAVALDLEENEQRLAELEERYRSTLASDSTLLEYVYTGEWEHSPDSLGSVTMRAFSMGYFRPAMGTYQDMVNAGKLQLIRDAEIRKGLASLVETVELVHTAIGYLGERWTAIEEPYLVKNLPVTGMWDSYPRGYDPDLQARVGTLSLLPPGGTSLEIPRTEEFANHLALRMVLVYDVLWFRETLGDEVRALRELVTREMEAD